MPKSPDNITDALRRRETFLQRFAGHLVNTDLDKAIQTFSRKLPSLLNEFGEAEGLTLAERRAVTRMTSAQMRSDWLNMWDGVTTELDQVAINEGEFIHDIYADIKDTDLRVPDDEVILGHVKRSTMVLTSGQSSQAGVWAKYIKENTDTAVKSINGAIWNGYTNQETNAQILRDIRGTFNKKTGKFTGGLLQGRTKAQAEALIRTGTNHFANQARDRTYIANRDVLGKRVLIATRDSRTSDICISRDGDEFDIDDNSYPRLPFHFNERSVYTVTVKGEDLTEEEKQDTWDSFLRKQPKSFVEDTLGKSRAALFIDGKVNVTRFTDMTGKTITLKELKAKPSLKTAFDKADL